MIAAHVAAVAVAACRSGVKADRRCTPSALNPTVTQATIHSTICVPGWTATIRPPQAVTEPQKFSSMRAYGIPTSPGHAGLYEFDHLVPLELGGAPDDTGNLWPEAHAGARGSFVKDREENALHAAVCSGRSTLAAAVAKILRDWRSR